MARSSVSAWRTGRNLPSASNTQAFLRVIRVATEAARHQAAAGYMVDRLIGEAEWVRLLMTARSTPPPRGQRRRNIATAEQVATAKLLFRIYVPSERLYAAEAHEVLSLFRDWLIKARGHRVRQSGYRTKSGEVYEFFADDSVVQVDLRDEFGNFSGFLGLCSTDPEAAADVLADAGVERASSTALVATFAKDARRLHTDLRHERERRMLTLRHSLEGELVDSGVDLQGGTGSHLGALLERLVPRPSAPDPLALLTAHEDIKIPRPLIVNINSQIIRAAESTIIQNVEGSVNLQPQAREILELVNRFGGRETGVLKSAVYELEDTDAPTESRSDAKRKLKQFLGQLADAARDIGVDLLEKYLEHKTGL